jgi:hypothetical protein
MTVSSGPEYRPTPAVEMPELRMRRADRFLWLVVSRRSVYVLTLVDIALVLLTLSATCPQSWGWGGIVAITVLGLLAAGLANEVVESRARFVVWDTRSSQHRYWR